MRKLLCACTQHIPSSNGWIDRSIFASFAVADAAKKKKRLTYHMFTNFSERVVTRKKIATKWFKMRRRKKKFGEWMRCRIEKKVKYYKKHIKKINSKNKIRNFPFPHWAFISMRESIGLPMWIHMTYEDIKFGKK